MRKLVSAALAASLCLGLTACGSGVTETTAAAAKKEKIRVCVVYTGLLGDMSYNDSCHAGAEEAAEDFDIELEYLEGSIEEEWESNLLAACEEGYDLVIGVSSNITDYIVEHGPNYPDTKFAVIDTTVDLPNVQSITFAQNEGSFLAGAAAAMFTERTDIAGVNEETVIGWVGGMDIPALRDFFTGYEQGAKYINPDITILQAFADDWSSPFKGKELTFAQYEQGADIVMNVASGTGAGIFEGAKEQGRYAIGADLDQDSLQPGHILTSMVKHVDKACYLAIQSVVEGTFRGGTTQYLTLKNGGVSLTDFSVMRAALGDRFPEEIITKIDELTKKIADGEIKVESCLGD